MVVLFDTVCECYSYCDCCDNGSWQYCDMEVQYRKQLTSVICYKPFVFHWILGKTFAALLNKNKNEILCIFKQVVKLDKTFESY